MSKRGSAPRRGKSRNKPKSSCAVALMLAPVFILSALIQLPMGIIRGSEKINNKVNRNLEGRAKR